MSLLYMVVNRETMQVLQLGALDTICTKQFLEDPEAPIDTSPVGFGGSYSCYSREQLRAMATHLGISADLPYGDAIKAIKAVLIAKYAETKPLLKSLDYYEAQLKKRMQKEPELYSKFEPEEPEPVVTKRSISIGKASTTKTASPTARPAGGTTKKVWDIADALKARNPSLSAKELRPKIIEACQEENINSSTAGTQYSKWKNTVEWSQ